MSCVVTFRVPAERQYQSYISYKRAINNYYRNEERRRSCTNKLRNREKLPKIKEDTSGDVVAFLRAHFGSRARA